MNRRYLQHYRETLKLGLPMVVGQVGVIVLGFADTVMVGHYDTASLAAASFVNNVFNLAIVALLGFSYGITPLIGALFARGEYEKAGREFRHALIANVSFGVALTLVMGTLYFFLDRFGQPEELLPLIRSYYLTILASVVFVAWFNAMRQFTDSLTRTSVGMWILLFGNVFNICFNYLLIFGKFGFPELGLLGAGISTLGARIYLFVAAKRVCSLSGGFLACAYGCGRLAPHRRIVVARFVADGDGDRDVFDKRSHGRLAWHCGFGELSGAYDNRHFGIHVLL